MATRKDYYKWVWQYKKRRESHKEQIRVLTKKISQWNNEIRRIDTTVGKLKKISSCVNEYFSVDISSRKMDANHKLARCVYYKISIESKIQGKIVSEHIGRSKKMAGMGRLYFTRTFTSMPENKEHYYRFKRYYESCLQKDL